MKRRDLMLAGGALALAGVSRAAPDAGSAPGKGASLVELGSACIQVGEECEAHCLEKLATGDTPWPRARSPWRSCSRCAARSSPPRRKARHG
jgi:hypothetical protein